MGSKKIILFIFILLTLSIFVNATIWSPQGNISLKNRYYVTNDPIDSCSSGEFVQGKQINGSWNCTVLSTAIGNTTDEIRTAIQGQGYYNATRINTTSLRAESDGFLGVVYSWVTGIVDVLISNFIANGTDVTLNFLNITGTFVSADYSNVTITESQVSDLVHTGDGNTTDEIRTAVQNQGYYNETRINTTSLRNESGSLGVVYSWVTGIIDLLAVLVTDSFGGDVSGTFNSIVVLPNSTILHYDNITNVPNFLLNSSTVTTTSISDLTDYSGNTTSEIRTSIEGVGYLLNGTDATLNHLNITGTFVSADYNNVTITELQISDLVHTTNTDDQNASEVNITHLTGATFYSVQDFIRGSSSNGVITGGIITDNGDGTINVSGGSIMIRTSNSDTAPLVSANFSTETNVALTDNSLNIVHLEYNSGSPQIRIGPQALGDPNSNVVLGAVFRDGTHAHITNINVPTSQAIQKISLRLAQTEGLQRATGALISETGTQNFAISAGTWWVAINAFSTNAIDTSVSDTFTYFYQNGTGGFFESPAQTQINNTGYDDGDGGLAILNNNKYGVHWIYIATDSTVSALYGTDTYSLSEAEEATAPTTLPGQLGVLAARLVGKIIIKKDATSFTSTQSPFVTQFIAGTPTDHGELTGLTDDDHTQYLLADGLRVLTANWNAVFGISSANWTNVTITESQINDLSVVIGNTTDEIRIAIKDQNYYNATRINTTSLREETGTVLGVVYSWLSDTIDALAILIGDSFGGDVSGTFDNLVVLPNSTLLDWDNITATPNFLLNASTVTTTSISDLTDYFGNTSADIQTAIESVGYLLNGTSVTFTTLNITSRLVSQDWSNATITESQISDLSIVLGNTTDEIRIAIKGQGYYNESRINATSLRQESDGFLGVDYSWVVGLTSSSVTEIHNQALNTTSNVTFHNVSAINFVNSTGQLEWIRPENIFDVDKEDIENDLNTFVDIGGDVMTGTLNATIVNIDDQLNSANWTNVTITESQISDLHTQFGNNTEEIQDSAWDVTSGTQTLITVTYQDGTDDVDFIVTNTLSSYNNDIGFLANASTVTTTSINDLTDYNGNTTAEIYTAMTNSINTTSLRAETGNVLGVVYSWVTGIVDSLISNFIGNGTDATLNHLNITGTFVSADYSNVTITESQIGDLSHTTDTGPSPDCSGTTTYQDGEGNCDVLDELGDFTNDLGFITNGTSVTFTTLNITSRLVSSDWTNITLTESQISDLHTQFGNNTEEIQDSAWLAVTGGTETLITVTYQDGTDDVDFIVTDTLSSYTNDAGFLANASTVTTTSIADLTDYNGNTTAEIRTAIEGVGYLLNGTSVTFTTLNVTSRLVSSDWTNITLLESQISDLSVVLGNTTEEIQDAVWASGIGTQTLIAVTYQDGTNDVDFVVTNTLSSYNNDAGFLANASTVTTTSIADLTDYFGNTSAEMITAVGPHTTSISDLTDYNGNTTEEMQDSCWAVTSGTQTLITVTYQDGTNDVDFVVTNTLSSYDNDAKFITNDSNVNFTTINTTGNVIVGGSLAIPGGLDVTTWGSFSLGSTVTSGLWEFEDGSVCIGSGGCAAPTADGYLYAEQGIVIDTDGISTTKSGFLIIGDGTDGAMGIEIEDGSMCIGNGGCTAPTTDGNLLLEGDLEIQGGDITTGTIRFGTTSSSGQFEFEDGGVCIGNGGCSASSTDGTLYAENSIYIDADGSIPTIKSGFLIIGDGVDGAAGIEIEDGSMCIGNAGCSVSTTDGTLYVETSIMIDADGTTPTSKSGFLVIGDGVDGSAGIEIEDGSMCIGDGGCTAPATDGHLLIEGGLNVSGIVHQTGASRLLAIKSDAQTIASSVVTTVIYGTETFDTLGEHNAATGIFTAANTGYYQVNWALLMASTANWGAGEAFYTYLSKGDSNTGGNAWNSNYLELHASQNIFASSTGSVIVQLDAGENLRVKVVQQSGANLNVWTNSRYNHFSIHKLS